MTKKEILFRILDHYTTVESVDDLVIDVQYAPENIHSLFYDDYFKYNDNLLDNPIRSIVDSVIVNYKK